VTRAERVMAEDRAFNEQLDALAASLAKCAEIDRKIAEEGRAMAQDIRRILENIG